MHFILFSHKFSTKPDERLFCEKRDLISMDMQTKGFQKPQDIMKVKSSLFVLSSSAKITTELKSNVKKYLHGKETGTYATFDDWKFVMTNIYELTEDGNFYKYCCVMV